jgi:hypothetical protein
MPLSALQEGLIWATFISFCTDPTSFGSMLCVSKWLFSAMNDIYWDAVLYSEWARKEIVSLYLEDVVSHLKFTTEGGCVVQKLERKKHSVKDIRTHLRRLLEDPKIERFLRYVHAELRIEECRGPCRACVLSNITPPRNEYNGWWAAKDLMELYELLRCRENLTSPYLEETNVFDRVCVYKTLRF